MDPGDPRGLTGSIDRRGISGKWQLQRWRFATRGEVRLIWENLQGSAAGVVR